MRSKLFVPGVRPDLFSKAYASCADYVSIDLEDAIASARKAEARDSMASYLATQTPEIRAHTVVRINAFGTSEFEHDLATVVPLDVALVNLPCVDSAEQVIATMKMIESIEAANGLPSNIRLLVNIETPKGLRYAADIATAHVRVMGLQLGLGDLFELHGICRDEPSHVRMAMMQVAMAAAEAGVIAFDGAHPDYRNADRFEHEAKMAQALGFVGKSCIHPNQVEWANRIFQISQAELAQARRTVEAARHASLHGHAVFTVDGRMVDLPYLRRAERLLEHACQPSMHGERRP